MERAVQAQETVPTGVKPGRYLLYSFSRAALSEILDQLSAGESFEHDPQRFPVSASQLPFDQSDFLLWVQYDPNLSTSSARFLDGLRSNALPSLRKSCELPSASVKSPFNAYNSGVDMVVSQDGRWTSLWAKAL